MRTLSRTFKDATRMCPGDASNHENASDDSFESAIVPSSHIVGSETVLIQRGREMLSELNRELLIAKAEKTRALLTQAIAAAEHGDLSALQEILVQQDKGHESSSPNTVISQPHFRPLVRMDHEAVPSLGDQTPDNTTAFPLSANTRDNDGAGGELAPGDPWSQLLSIAMQRNALRRELLANSEEDNPVDASRIFFPLIAKARSSVFKPFDSDHANSDRSISTAELELEHSRSKTFDFLTPSSHQTLADGLLEEPESEKPISEDILSISKSLERDLESDESPTETKLLARGAKIVTVSLLFHVLLVIFLGFVTLTLPMPKGTMLFEASASDSATDTFELSEAVEATEPTDVTEPTEETSPTTELATDFSEMSDMSFEGPAVAPPKATSVSSALKAQATNGANARAAASFFGAAATGNCICFVIDASPSMKGGPWEAAMSELIKSLSTMSPKQRFYIVFIDSKTSAITMPGESEPSKRALYATPENVTHAKTWLRSVDPGTTAPPSRALKAALATEPDAIYFLADGDTKEDLVKLFQEINRSQDLLGNEQIRAAIHTIAFYSEEKGIDLMRRLAADNRGQFIYVPNPVQKTRKR